MEKPYVREIGGGKVCLGTEEEEVEKEKEIFK
jgi:hypothetical protein